MVAKTFNGTSGTYNWSTSAADWTPAGVPAAGDTVTIGTGSALRTINIDVSTAALGSLTISQQNVLINVGANTLNVDNSATSSISMAAGTITVAGGTINVGATGSITFTGTSAGGSAGSLIPTLSGRGTVNAAVVNNKAANPGAITATGGTLELKGAVTDTTSNLTMTITGATDKLMLDAASAAHTVTFSSSGTLELNTAGTLTVGTAMAIGTGTLKLDGSASTLTDTSGITVTTGTISGIGKIAAAISATGAAHITETGGGTLEITGAVTNGAGGAAVLTVGSTSSDILKLDALGNSVTTLAFSSSTGSGTLELGSGATLTASSNTAIAVGSNTIKLDGASLTDSGATGSMTIAAGGTITSSGTGALNVGATHAIANSGTIDVTGGTLTVTGLITDTGSSAITIGSGATLTTSQLITNTSGTITLNGGTLTDTGGLTLSAGALTGHGSVTTTTLTGAGILEASGGTLTINNPLDASGTQLEIASGSTLDLAGTIGVSGSTVPTLQFLAATGIFQATAAVQGNVHLGTITGFSGTDQIQLRNSGAGGDKIVVSGDTLHIETSGGTVLQTYTFAAGTAMSNIAISDNTTAGVDTLTICFMAGTLVRTPDGEVAIETLKPGDLVLTSEGVAKPVNWLGKQTVSTLFADPIRSLPIRVRAGALAENVPSRDLLVSPDHALLVDNVLIHAGALVNGTSITRESNVPKVFVYYHVELDDHSLILAENTPAETFVDNVDRLNFDNWAEFEALYPEGKSVEELPFPRAKAHRQVPVYIRVALADRAQVLGLAVGAGETAVA